ncbi:hypothetical protein ACIQMR_37935 [Streptomyces sp. NPDC091376]|uniref:hypothetical protein n=1 Tax=Streptomyces sp. NPDC091376 TaxID=3365994 RepID=UPI003803062D
MALPVLAAELTAAWVAIQKHHPDLPDLTTPESLIGESSAVCGAGLSFQRLLHEAAHGIAAARGLRDTSRGGRYHNRRFLSTAEELGMKHSEHPHPSHGFSLVQIRTDTRRLYLPAIERFQHALNAHSALALSDSAAGFYDPASRHRPFSRAVGRVKAVCDCRRNVRVVMSVLALAPIICTACGTSFRIPEREENHHPTTRDSQRTR